MNDVGARAYYAASGLKLLAADPAAILGTLVSQHSFAVEERQRNTWLAEISHSKPIAGGPRPMHRISAERHRATMVPTVASPARSSDNQWRHLCVLGAEPKPQLTAFGMAAVLGARL
jgi:hypothetical protein